MSSIKKKMISLNLYDSSFDCKTYYGRLLGIIDDQEFAAMLSDPKLQSRCMTKSTKSLSDITDTWYDLTGYRLVMALRKIDGKEVFKRLLVTDKLGLVSFIRSAGEKSLLDVGISVADDKDSYIYMQEEEGD
jgi:hypothetical protein